MAFADFMLTGSYSRVENLSYSKQKKVLGFDLVVYETSDLKTTVNRLDYRIITPDVVSVIDSGRDIPPGTKQQSQVTIDGTSLGGKHFYLPFHSGRHYFWFNVDGGSTKPTSFPDGMEVALWEVAIASSDTQDQIAQKLRDAIDEASLWLTPAISNNVVTVTHEICQQLENAADVDTGLTISTPVTGNCDAQAGDKYQISSTPINEWKSWGPKTVVEWTGDSWDGTTPDYVYDQDTAKYYAYNTEIDDYEEDPKVGIWDQFFDVAKIGGQSGGSDTNVLRQCYEWLKTKPEFSSVTDV